MPRKRSAVDIAADLSRFQVIKNKNKNKTKDKDFASLVHEISVYHEEVLVQNDTLLRMQSELEESRNRFVDLYDFAPTAYLTLDRNGVILQCNLTCASWLGRARNHIEGYPLVSVVWPRDWQRFLQFHSRCRRSLTESVEEELHFQTPGGIRACQVVARAYRRRDGNQVLMSLLDVTEHRRIEKERERFAQDHAALSTRLIAAQDAERLRLARHLHDDVGQQYTALRLTLERLAQTAADDAQREIIDLLQDMLGRLDQRVHFMATELRPATLDLGLGSALQQFVRDWSKTFGVPARFVSQMPEEARPTPEIETHLYRIAQEALNNIAKHAAAKHVSVLLAPRQTDIVLVIEDDGRGFDVKRAQAGRRLGLLGMRERAELIKGRLDIESEPGRGTSVFVTVPASPPPRMGSQQRLNDGDDEEL